MKKVIIIMLISISFPLFSQEDTTPPGMESALVNTQAKAAIAGSENSIALSMVIWGVGIATVITLLAILIHSDTAHAHNQAT